MELRSIIEKGVEELESIADVKWQTKVNSYMTRDRFISSFETSLVEDIPLYESIGFAYKSGFAASVKRVFTNIQDRPDTIVWLSYILKLAGYKYCKKCKQPKLFEEFNNNKASTTGKSSYCRECNTNQSFENRKEAVKIIDMLSDKGIICNVCGYADNFAAIHFHHIDASISRPNYAVGRVPGSYMLSCNSINTTKERFLEEKENIEFLCSNCHAKEHWGVGRDTQKGLKLALKDLGYVYKCNMCNEDKHLHLHHNNSNEKNVSFYYFQDQTKERILKDSILYKEMKKDVSILCGNHHLEIHNPKLKLPEYIL